jgi:hypothetical protein
LAKEDLSRSSATMPLRSSSFRKLLALGSDINEVPWNIPSVATKWFCPDG